MKVLILENVHHLEPECTAFLNEYFAGHELDKVFDLSNVEPDALVEKILWADAIVVESIFNSTTQFEQMIDTFAALAWKGDVYILHKLNKLLETVNSRLTVPYMMKLAELMENGVRLHNVYHEQFEEPSDPDDYLNMRKYFKKFIYRFDIVPMWKHPTGMIWDERPMYIPWSMKTYFKPGKYEVPSIHETDNR